MTPVASCELCSNPFLHGTCRLPGQSTFTLRLRPLGSEPFFWYQCLNQHAMFNQWIESANVLNKCGLIYLYRVYKYIDHYRSISNLVSICIYIKIIDRY